MGSLRQQFSLAGNILLSLRSAGFLMKDLKTELAIDGAEPPDIQFTRGSYLFLSTQKGKETLQQNHQMQRLVCAHMRMYMCGLLYFGMSG